MDQKALPVGQHELNAAFFNGLNAVHGDREMLEEMGYATTPESFQNHVAAGRDVAAAISKNGTPVSTETVKKIAAFCADCYNDVPAGQFCEHISVDAKGKITPRYPRN